MLDPKKIILTQIFEGGGGGGDVDVEPLSVTENGEYTADEGKAYSPVSVSVPNSYAAGDEGKVVSNGALVSQTSDTATQNGTVDTTLINSLTVNVSGGGSSGFDLLATKSLGTFSNVGTSSTDTGQTITVPGVVNSDYDVLTVVTKVSTRVENRHVATFRVIYLYGSTNIGTKDASLLMYMLNIKDSSGVLVSNASSSPYGVVPNSLSFSGSDAVMPIYIRQNNTQTGTIDGDYTMYIYGSKLAKLAGLT